MLLFSLGVVAILLFQQLPSWGWSCGLFFLCLPFYLFLRRRWLGYFLSFCSGFFYVWLVSQHLLGWSLPSALEGKTLPVSGHIVSLPIHKEDRTRFVFLAESLRGQHCSVRMLLTWYHPTASLKVGQRWQLAVRLKRPHGLRNPGGRGL